MGLDVDWGLGKLRNVKEKDGNLIEGMGGRLWFQRMLHPLVRMRTSPGLSVMLTSMLEFLLEKMKGRGCPTATKTT